MTRRLGIAQLTLLETPPPELLSIAAEAGADCVGIRLIPVLPGTPFAPLITDAPLMRETLRRIAATGVQVFDIEIVRLEPDTDVARFTPFFEAGARLGAKAILVAAYDPEPARLAENYARFCDAAAPYGLTADLEFMPWTAVPNVRAAVALLAQVDRPNAGILVDPIHFDRSGSTLADLAMIRPDWLHYWQLCDAPAAQPADLEEMLHQARAERLRPGQGGLDLPALIRAMPPDLPVSLEVPEVTLARSVAARARGVSMLREARAFLSQHAA
ncbi:sugar phosphate isomerase/epimerase [Roseomonas frigidaquae]|uniref:Sugar phosphate isomerase/epimerase n=1 Tax=Falsiroseomonas frigidaquae TaxID=487318 RepID=A0ABX1EZG7_9PROT|nr:sugar phosphate isomerase/epimerase [Falsiroseomonas frigidaquae]NKE45475.1 sugar phosphate isomerase/epimerase [Falsiroseomonas frigidaquae]